jgi:hypothetical protein
MDVLACVGTGELSNICSISSSETMEIFLVYKYFDNKAKIVSQFQPCFKKVNRIR